MLTMTMMTAVVVAVRWAALGDTSARARLAARRAPPRLALTLAVRATRMVPIVAAIPDRTAAQRTAAVAVADLIGLGVDSNRRRRRRRDERQPAPLARRPARARAVELAGAAAAAERREPPPRAVERAADALVTVEQLF
jgi:hypothetical protein